MIRAVHTGWESGRPRQGVETIRGHVLVHEISAALNDKSGRVLAASDAECPYRRVDHERSPMQAPMALSGSFHLAGR